MPPPEPPSTFVKNTFYLHSCGSPLPSMPCQLFMQCNIPTMIYQSNIYSRIVFFFFKTNSVPILDPVSSGARPSRSRWSAFVTNFHGNARWEEAIGRGKRFPDAIVCNLLEESIVPFSYQSCTVQPQHWLQRYILPSLCGKQRLAIYYTTGSCWEINSHPHLHQAFQFGPSMQQHNPDEIRKWLDGMMRVWRWPWCDSDCANFQMSKKPVYWLRGIVARERRFRRYDLAYMDAALSIPHTPPRAHGRPSQREMALLCSPLCLLFYVHTQGTRHMSKCPE